MKDRNPLELEECPDCRGVGALCHEGGWCVYVECLDCGAHTAYVEYANPEEQEEAERRSAALWNMGKVIHMRPGNDPCSPWKPATGAERPGHRSEAGLSHRKTPGVRKSPRHAA